jgi:hypothetical protein
VLKPNPFFSSIVTDCSSKNILLQSFNKFSFKLIAYLLSGDTILHFQCEKVENDSEKQKERYENTGKLVKLNRFSSIFHVYPPSSTENKLANPSSGNISRRTNLLTAEEEGEMRR